GGGTPSLFQPESIARVLDAIDDLFPTTPGDALEVTLEVNPSTVERERLPGFRDAGVNRLSVGIQSFDDRVLQSLGRAHRADEGRETLVAARRAGFANLSIDLILGGPHSTPAQFDADLEEIFSWGPEHLSAYVLTVEAGTPFATAAQRGQLALPDGDAVADLLERLEKRTRGFGLERYEISNYARPGFESRHNRRYRSRVPVLGIGMGAWSNDPPTAEARYGSRRGNTRELSGYLERVEGGEPAEADAEVLDAATARGETVFLGLRQLAGLAAEGFAAEFGEPPRHWFGAEIDELLEVELLTENAGGDLALTSRGRLLADEVFQRFVA
ncbi:MAG: coproporphyrinogen-III oxidase family protein, partial [Myxococcota bacterium]